MKNIFLSLILLSLTTSCSEKSLKSEREKTIDDTNEIIMSFFNAQLSGDIETMMTLVSSDFTYTLNGQLDISKTYDWDEYIEFQGYFSTLLKGEVGGEFLEIIPGEKSAIIFLNGKMEGVGGAYNNEYALKYVINEERKVSKIKEYLSDLLLAQKLYGQDLCGEKMNQ